MINTKYKPRSSALSGVVVAALLLTAALTVSPSEAYGVFRGLEGDWENSSASRQVDAFDPSLPAKEGELDTQRLYHSRLRLDAQRTYIAAGFGRSNSWQDFGGSFGMQLAPKFWLQLSPGAGFHRSEGVGAPDIRFFQDLTSLSLHAASRYYFWRAFPVFIQGGLGGVRWSGDVDPSRNINESASSPEPLLESDYTGTGIYADIELGFSYAFKSGFFIDYRLAGVSKAFLLSSDLQSDQNELADNIGDSLEDFFTYGLLNIRLGFIW